MAMGGSDAEESIRSKRKRRRRPAASRTGKPSRALAATALAFLLLPCVYYGSFEHVALATTTDATAEPETEIWLEALEEDTGSIQRPKDGPPLPRKESPDEEHRSMAEELQLHAENQHDSQDRVDKERSINEQEKQQYRQFSDWCRNVLGIQTSLEIHTFYYYDYMTATLTYPQEGDSDDDDDDNFLASNSSTVEKEWKDPPLIPVRGLRATRNISEGEVIISIPFQALLTVSTTIDQDPVLGRVMGKDARKAYGWTLQQDGDELQTGNLDSVDFFELPLLAMALLHHYNGGGN